MTDLKSMSTFEKYVQALSLVAPEQLERCKRAQQGLRELGIPKSLEELTIRLGVLDAERLGSILGEIKQKWGISVPRPVMYDISDESDRALQDQLVQQSSKNATQVLECREVMEKARELGVELKVAEILIAKGYYALPGSASKKPPTPPPGSSSVKSFDAPAEAPASSPKPQLVSSGDPSLDDLLPDVPELKKAPVKVEAPKQLSPRKPLGGTKPASARAGRSGKAEEEDGASAPAGKTNPKLTFWIGIGSAAAIFIIAIVLLVVKSGDAPPPKDETATKPKAVVAKRTEKAPDVKPAIVEPPRGGEAPKPPETPKAPEETPPRVVEPPRPAPKPEPVKPESAPAPKPEPEKDPEPAKPAAAPVPVQSPNKPVAASWKFEEAEGDSVSDDSGNGNFGTLKGGVTRVAGILGRALAFDGATGYVDCGTQEMPPANASQTIAGWYSVPSIPKDVQLVIHLSNAGANSGIFVGFRNSKISAWKMGGDVLVAADPPPANAWHHIAYTFDGSTHRLYVDGALAATSRVPPQAAIPTRVEIGRWQGGPNDSIREYFRGILDDLSVHNRVLSDSEIRTLAPRALVGKSAPLTALPGPSPKPGLTAKGAADDDKRKERERKAQELWELADRLEKENKLADAQDRLRELRSRYRGTIFYWDHAIEISDKINDIGTRLALASLGRTTMYKRPHVDSWFSYEFVPPQGWKGVPPDQAMSGDMDSSEVNYSGRIERLCRYTSNYLDKVYCSVYKLYDGKSVDGLEAKVLASFQPRYEGLKQDGDTKIERGRMEYVRKIFVSERGDRLVFYFFVGNRKALALVGIWRSGGEDDGWIMITTTSNGVRTTRKTQDHPVTKEHFDLALKLFDQSAKSFMIYDQATQKGKMVQLNNGALCSDWSTMMSAKGMYLIEYATKPEFAKRVGDELETIVGLYHEVIPNAKGTPRVRVKVFDREEDFVYYAGFYGAAAYWSPMQEEIVCYRFQGDKVRLKESNESFAIQDNEEEVTFHILYHEAFHQYMYYMMGRDRMVYVPSWLNEGMGDYFFGGGWQKSPRKFQIGVNDWRIKRIVKAVKENKHIPLAQIFRYEQRQYYSNPGLCYAEGWSINYFFLTSDAGKKKGYSLIPRTMMAALLSSGNWEKATDKVFQGIDLKKMEEEWKEFVLGLPIPKDAKGGGDPDDPFGDK